MKKTFLFAFALLCAWAAQAKVVLPQLFQSGMVLQRGCPIPVWGVADAGETVVVTFRKKTYTATADSQGRWQVTLPKQKAGGPYELQVAARSRQGETSEPIVLSDVLVGDVWLCSGQSNIDVTIERVYPQYPDFIDSYANDRIRLFRVQTDFDTHGPRADIRPTPTAWKPLSKQNAWLFSAVGYFLGYEMFQKSNVPQGIIVNSLGGSPIQAWLDADTLKRHFPREFARTEFFQDDAMVQALQAANRQAGNRWNEQLAASDPGLAQHYADRDFDDSQWPLRTVFRLSPEGHQQPVNLTASGNHHGSCWARQTFQIDAAHAGKPARLLVGTLFDADQTYVNGREVGHTGYQYPPRRYSIPAGVLEAGANAIAIRFVTHGGSPHFIPDKPYKLIFDDGTEVALTTEWRVAEGAALPACPQTDAGGQNLPSVLYNAMLYPLAPYSLSGVVWYQGESNTGDGFRYGQMLSQLINGWRQLWQSKQESTNLKPETACSPLPFVVVQLANFMEPSSRPQNSGWSQVREAQRLVARQLPQTELAVAIDLGEAVDIHPLRKHEVAQRVARCFDHMLWHPNLPLSPQVVAHRVEADQILLTTDEPLRNGSLQEFEVAAADDVFHPAQAQAQGNVITIQSPVDKPCRVRYAWKNNPDHANVFSTDGLPMSPFQLTLQPGN